MTNAKRTTPASVNGILVDLWENGRTDYSEEELQWYSSATEHANMLASQLQDTLESLACLAIEDDEHSAKGEMCAGIFQGGRVTSALFLVANNLDVIQGLIHVGDSASYRLAQLYKEKSNNKGKHNGK